MEEKVFDFISIAKSDVSNWYCIHAYFIEIQMVEKYGFFDFSSFFMLLDRFLLSQHRKSSDFAVFTTLELVLLNQTVAKNQ